MNVCEYIKTAHMLEFSPQQMDAIMCDNNRILLLAVPGAGKTTVATARIARLIFEEGILKERLLVLTFNKESVRDMERRWHSFFDGLMSESPRFQTIHSFCYSVIKEYAQMRGSKIPTLLEEEGTSGKSKIFRQIYRDISGEYLQDDKLNQYVNLSGYCINMQQEPQSVIEELALDADGFPELFERYTRWKRDHRVMDFDDMLLFAYTALSRSDLLRSNIQHRFPHILIDESQDTSKIQQKIIDLISSESLFMVGDEDQSIYGFRGANPDGLLSFFERYPNGKLLKLEENYRSTPQIIEAADALIKTNSKRYQKNIFTNNPAGATVRLIRDVTIAQQYTDIAKRCTRLAQNGESVAVLYRASNSGIGVAYQLSKLGTNFSASASRISYVSDFVTRDIINILRLAANPSDKSAFHQVYFRLGISLTRQFAKQVLDEAEGNVFDYLLDTNDLSSRNSAKILYIKRVLKTMSSKTPLQQIKTIISKLDYLDTLEKRGPSGYLMNSYLQRLAIIYNFAIEARTTYELVEQLADAEKLLVMKGKRKIRLSTVHSSKGQEYDHVIIVDALEGVFPASDVVEYNSLGWQSQMDEETRLFYTAMTRAKKTLTIYSPDSCFDRETLPSRFLVHAKLLTDFTVSGLDIRVGMGVSHTFFGTGSIVSINLERNLFEADFKHYGRKSFGLDSLSNQKLFKLFQ